MKSSTYNNFGKKITRETQNIVKLKQVFSKTRHANEAYTKHVIKGVYQHVIQEPSNI